jgi:hypothetical protein
VLRQFIYPADVKRDESSYFLVTFPDFPHVLRTAAVVHEEPQCLGILHDRNLARAAADENGVKVFGAIGEGRIWSNGDTRIRHHQVLRFPHEVNICGRGESCLGTEQVHQGQTRVQQSGDFRLLLIMHRGELSFACLCFPDHSLGCYSLIG